MFLKDEISYYDNMILYERQDKTSSGLDILHPIVTRNSCIIHTNEMIIAVSAYCAISVDTQSMRRDDSETKKDHLLFAICHTEIYMKEDISYVNTTINKSPLNPPYF